MNEVEKGDVTRREGEDLFASQKRGHFHNADNPLGFVPSPLGVDDERFPGDMEVQPTQRLITGLRNLNLF